MARHGMTVSAGPRMSPDAITSNSEITRILNLLDSIGFNVGDTRISVWTASVVVIVLLGTILAARLGSRLARIAFTRMTRLDPTQQLLGEKIVSILVWALAILLAVDLLGIDLTALAVFSGAFGLAIGFGLQKTFGNLIAGIILLMDRSIKPGDVIAVADASGKESFGQVKKIGIRAVSVTTRDQREYLIPNENLMTSQVENWSYSSRNVRMQVRVGVSYNADMARAEELMLQAAQACDRVLATPPPTVWMDEFGDSAVQFIIHCWIQDPEEGIGNVRSQVLKTLWKLFKDNGIEIPFPQRDVNLRQSKGLAALVNGLRGASRPDD
jgi:small-conductance mechanosensitive channel